MELKTPEVFTVPGVITGWGDKTSCLPEGVLTNWANWGRILVVSFLPLVDREIVDKAKNKWKMCN